MRRAERRGISAEGFANGDWWMKMSPLYCRSRDERYLEIDQYLQWQGKYQRRDIWGQVGKDSQILKRIVLGLLIQTK